MEPIIGIDLGTTNSLVACVVDGQPRILPGRGGGRLTPSVVACTPDGKWLIGDPARRQAITNPAQTIVSAKRLIGHRYSDARLQEMAPNLPYKVTAGDKDEPRVTLGERSLSIPEVAALVLAELRQDAETQLGQAVRKAVITVPAHFNDTQRAATRDAGTIAKLDVIRIINEPTAAALAYGFGKPGLATRVAVFDLGGGTFDFSLLDIHDGKFEVIATGGDVFLGGEDFDRRIVDWLAERFIQTHRLDPRQSLEALQRLREAAEKAKCELSTATEAKITLPFLMKAPSAGALHVETVLSRDTLEGLAGDLVQRALKVCERVLAEAHVGTSAVQDVVLVGGQSRMPLVRQMVTEMFGRAPVLSVDPEEAVALGAAIQGWSLAPKGEEILVDVTPHSLGIAIAGGYVQRLVQRNTAIPVSANHFFTTVKDDQTQAKIVVVQGEEDLAAENTLLGEFVMTGLRKAPRGAVEIEVIFEISSDGIVSVSAIDTQTNQEQSIKVTASSGLSPEEVKKAARDNTDVLASRRSQQEVEALRARAGELLGALDELQPRLSEAVRKRQMGPESLTRAQGAGAETRKHLRTQDGTALAAAVRSLEQLVPALRAALGS